MPRLVHVFLPAVAAALALAVTAPVIADQAAARPVRPDWNPSTDRLRAENEQLRAELGYYQSAYAELGQGLDRIEGLNRRSRDRRTMFQINRTVREARDRAARHVQPWAQDQQEPAWRDRDEWRTMPQPPQPQPDVHVHVRDRRSQPAPIVAPVVTMSERDFTSLAHQIGQASFADDKLALVQTAMTVNHVTVAQVVQLMQLASFDDTRVEIAAACAPRVLDGERWFEVYGALSFSASRDTLRQRLGGR